MADAGCFFYYKGPMMLAKIKYKVAGIVTAVLSTFALLTYIPQFNQTLETLLDSKEGEVLLDTIREAGSYAASISAHQDDNN